MALQSGGVSKGSTLSITDNQTVSDSIGFGFIIWARLVDIKITLSGLSHTFPDDLDFLLVGPNGAAFEFWSDAGGNIDIVNGNFTISDSAALSLPDGAAISSGTYRPADFNSVELSSNWGLAPSTTISHAAPNGSTTLDSAFSATWMSVANWTLYITDDASGDTGSLA